MSLVELTRTLTMRGFVILARMSAAHKSWGSYLDNSRMNNAIGKLDAFPIEVDLI